MTKPHRYENTAISPQIVKEEIDKRVFAFSYSINHWGKFVDTYVRTRHLATPAIPATLEGKYMKRDFI